ncbi:GNAT family N-acetyltransferase [Microbacterium sp. 1P10UB]|uniref:GNAT family N-acetyltransferase n=1 Tax=unclassified Microbacterium TaxID=2609290 RepID=UPI0039A182A2
MRVRPASPADADGIAAVHTTSWRETYGYMVDDEDAGPWFDLGRRTDMWRTNFAVGAFTSHVAIDEGDIVGFGSARPAPDSDAVRPEELTMLYVLARAHGTGAGQALLEAVLADRPAYLWVAADNPRAQAFYRRNGFEYDGTKSSFGPIGVTHRFVR